MKKFDSDDCPLKDIFSETYLLPYYQREYTWDTSQIQDLLEDFISEFKQYYRQGDTPSSVINYGYYFLGSIITDMNRHLVDGQQRLTSLSLLFIHLYHQLKNTTYKELAEQIQQLAYSQSFGSSEKNFVIDTPDRHKTMMAILNDEPMPANVSDSAAIIQKRYKDIQELFPTFPKDMLATFATWVGANVYVVLIKAENSADAYRIFSTQNDRGKPLSKMDMLKADIMSNIDDDKQYERNETWKSIISTLNDHSLGNFKKDVAEEEFVMSLLLQSHYAVEIVTHAEMKGKAGKKRPAMESDFIQARANPYKWVLANKDKVGLNTSDDYCRFIDEFQQYAEAYMSMREALDSNFCPKDLVNLYHLPPQYVSGLFLSVMLAPFKISDTPKQYKQKINLVARFLDIFTARYCFKQVSLSNETNYEYLFDELIKNIRSKDIPEIKYHLNKMIADRAYYISDFSKDIEKLKYPEGKRGKRYKELKWILSRVTAYLEVIENKPDLLHDYLTSEYHIEHILPKTKSSSWAKCGFADENDYLESRNNAAALLILQGSINKGLSDRPFQKKVETYHSTTGNTYAATLSFNDQYESASLKKLSKSIPFRSYNDFGAVELEDRKRILNALCKLIWNIDDFTLSIEEQKELADIYGSSFLETTQSLPQDIEVQPDENEIVEEPDDIEDEREDDWEAEQYQSGIYFIKLQDRSEIATVRIEDHDDGSKHYVIVKGSSVSPVGMTWKDNPYGSGKSSRRRYEAEQMEAITPDRKLQVDMVFGSPSATISFLYGCNKNGEAFKNAFKSGNYTLLTEDFPNGGTRNINHYCDYPQYVKLESFLSDSSDDDYRYVYVTRRQSYAEIRVGKKVRLAAVIEPFEDYTDIFFYRSIDRFGEHGPELTDVSKENTRHNESWKTRLRIPSNSKEAIFLFEKYFKPVLNNML